MMKKPLLTHTLIFEWCVAKPLHASVKVYEAEPIRAEVQLTTDCFVPGPNINRNTRWFFHVR